MNLTVNMSTAHQIKTFVTKCPAVLSGAVSRKSSILMNRNVTNSPSKRNYQWISSHRQDRCPESTWTFETTTKDTRMHHHECTRMQQPKCTSS